MKEGSLKDCVLRVLLSGCSALCGPCPAPGSKASLSNSLMHPVMKLASGVAPDNSSIQKLAFSLLANLALSRDCRSFLQKVSTINSPENLDLLVLWCGKGIIILVIKFYALLYFSE